MNTITLIALLVLLSPGQSHASPGSAAREMAAAPAMAGASWGLAVVDAASGRELLARGADLNLVPASTMKLPVTAAALEYLGPEKRFLTRLVSAEKPAGGVVGGDLYLVGGGDPSPGSEIIRNAPALPAVYSGWAEKLRAAGISSVRGGVVADESLFDNFQPGSWSWEDIGNYYAARPSALTVNDNTYRIYFRPGTAPGEKAEVVRTEPPMPGLSFENLMLTGPEGSGDNGYVFAFPGQDSAVLRGTIPQGPVDFAIKAALPDPALFAARALTESLSAAGIKLSGKPARGKAPPAAYELASSTSAPLSEIVRALNKRSFNLYAELLLRHLGLEKGAGGTPEEGRKAVAGFLSAEGAPAGAFSVADGSGLSRNNLSRAGDFARLLASVYSKPWFPVFYESLPFPGDPDAGGAMRRLGVGTELEGALRLKTGSLRGVRGYAGYLKTKKGKTLAFCSIVNNYTASGAAIDELHRDLLLELYKKY
ncbi:MAG: D-alanyl-D-alaninecarboxypeptidase/D-alanyl-D-al anine-endopeptidase [Elusimicrobia bacterium]|nr:MAG: D-alanyl-D-alaninecarboxypeptidase/D-alanyl-D-al anine-endopeptidase [Elusimicrobiota bacterium]KAF0158171.1 MAG: D-alanyl-D-alaninecarboxypeptidase/D-alanyl-D-al anine-endopeptidase [Elusimicrobiota bacterium]